MKQVFEIMGGFIIAGVLIVLVSFIIGTISRFSTVTYKEGVAIYFDKVNIHIRDKNLRFYQSKIMVVVASMIFLLKKVFKRG